MSNFSIFLMGCLVSCFSTIAICLLIYGAKLDGESNQQVKETHAKIGAS